MIYFDLFSVTLLAIFGGILGSLGFTFTTWPFWVLTVLVSVLYIYGVEKGVKHEKG